MLTVASEAWAHGGWWPIFPFFWLLFWVVLIFMFFRFRPWRHHHHHWSSGDSVLAERYAKGEISADEYRERLDVLRQSRERNKK